MYVLPTRVSSARALTCLFVIPFSVASVLAPGVMLLISAVNDDHLHAEMVPWSVAGAYALVAALMVWLAWWKRSRYYVVPLSVYIGCAVATVVFGVSVWWLDDLFGGAIEWMKEGRRRSIRRRLFLLWQYCWLLCISSGILAITAFLFTGPLWKTSS